MKKRFLFPFVASSLLLFSCSAPMVPYVNPDGTTIDESETISFDKSSVSLSVGGEETINAYVTGTSQVDWRNSNPSVVSHTVTADSVTLRGLTIGSSTISARIGKSLAICKVTVGGGGSSTIEVTNLSLNVTSKNMLLNDSFLLEASVTATGGTPVVSFSNSNDEAVSVMKQSDNVALVTAKAKGNSIITVSAGKLSRTCSISVDEVSEEFSIRLDKSQMTIEVQSSANLSASVVPNNLTPVWQSNNESVATVNQNGSVTGVSAGNAVITATITKDGESKTASCNVTVTGKQEQGEYEQRLATWSKPGHLYLHYLRDEGDYDNWALWIWQNRPNDYEGSLWGANPNIDFNDLVTPETYGSMTQGECGGSGNERYVDQYGMIIDVDLTKEDLLSGKARTLAPLVSDWTDISLNALGFLIVDQTKMDGSDNWTSDGGGETYITRLGRYMPKGKDSYLHVYCVQGNVFAYQTTSGTQTFENPTVDDHTGKYRSQNNITNLKADAWPNGVSTSTSFLEDRPGIGYQIFVPSFCDSDGDGFGDLQGIISQLQYLDDLGVKVLWLTPIQESNSYHGYDVTDYYKIDSKFGTIEDYQELIYKAHQRGMKVLMDMVINHTSKSNVLFRKSQVAAEGTLNGETFNYRDMYLWKYKGDKVLEWDGNIPADKQTPATYNSVNVEDNADWYKDGTSDYYYYGKFGSGMAELNYSCKATRDYMTDMCKYWLSFGLDGFRLDAIKHIYLLGELDPTYNYAQDYVNYDVSFRTAYNNEQGKYVTSKNDYTYDRDLNVIFWKQFAGTLKSAYPNCFLVGENFDGWNERIAPFYEAMDSQFDFSTYYHLHESTESGIVAMGGDINATLNYNKAYRSNHINGAFTSNHDVARFINHCASTVQTAHHAEVNSSNKALALKKARWDAAITLLTPGVSWIYYGDELGMSGNIEDKVADSSGNIYDDHGNNIDRWYRQPMRWGTKQGENGVVKYTFGGIEILWDKYNQTLPTVANQKSDQNSLLSLFTALCHVKNDSRYPTYGYIKNQWAEGSNQNVLCLQISDGVRTVNAFINATDSNMSIAALNRGSSFIGGSVGASQDTIPANGFSVVAL